MLSTSSMRQLVSRFCLGYASVTSIAQFMVSWQVPMGLLDVALIRRKVRGGFQDKKRKRVDDRIN